MATTEAKPNFAHLDEETKALLLELVDLRELHHRLCAEYIRLQRGAIEFPSVVLDERARSFAELQIDPLEAQIKDLAGQLTRKAVVMPDFSQVLSQVLDGLGSIVDLRLLAAAQGRDASGIDQLMGSLKKLFDIKNEAK